MRAAPSGGLLCRVLVALAVAASLCGACAGNAFAAGGQDKPTVVLVPGLAMTAKGMSPGPGGGGCGDQGGLSSLCQAYVNKGYDVYVPSTSTDGNGTVINSSGAVATNAQALADYVAGIGAPGGVSAVGFSMGGLIVVDAIRNHGMAVNDVTTIGAPLDGSYVADNLTAAANQTCSDDACQGVAFAAQSIINAFGPDAIADLTSSARAAANAGQQPLGVPTTTIAGNGCGGNSDCLVSVDSALGTNSNLGPTTQMTAPDVHTGGPGDMLGILCGLCTALPDDPDVAQFATKISLSTSSTPSGCGGTDYCIPSQERTDAVVPDGLPLARDAAFPRGLRFTGDARSAAAPENVKLILDTTSWLRVIAGGSRTITGADLIASTSPYATACAGKAPVPPKGSSRLYYTDPVAQLGCTPNAATVHNAGSRAIHAEIFSDPATDDAQATVGAAGGKLVPIVVSAKVGITNVKIITKAGKVLQAVNGHGRQTVTFMARRTLASQQILSASLSSQHAAFSAPLPPLPAALAKATVTVSPGNVRHDHKVTISGHGWAPGNVTLSLLTEDTDHPSLLARVGAKANAQGNFTLTFKVPGGIQSRTSVALTAGEAQRALARATFTIRR